MSADLAFIHVRLLRALCVMLAASNLPKRSRHVGCGVVLNACGPDRQVGPTAAATEHDNNNVITKAAKQTIPFAMLAQYFEYNANKHNPPTPIRNTSGNGVVRNACGVAPSVTRLCS